MKTLIELYDERPVENVISTEMFRPECTVFICPEDVASNRELQKKLKQYFKSRNISCRLEFISASVVDAMDVADHIRKIAGDHPDCAVDIAGGTDAALFATGMIYSEIPLPVFTYSRRQNMFFSISNAPFAHQLPCDIRLKIRDCFLMAGGSIRTGRVDNRVLGHYDDLYQPFFDCFMRHRRDWTKIITYIQRISLQGRDEAVSLKAEGGKCVKGEQGSRVYAPEETLRELEDISMIRELNITEDQVGFVFRDEQCRAWLRDVGSVLELYTRKVCRDTGLFDDVQTSVIVDWQGDDRPDNVINEIDVMAVRGIRPVFISCKACAVKTEALNELAILRDRFGSGIARAAIITTEQGRKIMRHRAQELDIAVIDLADIQKGLLKGCIEALCR
ncbi:MAG: hypothetical protein CW338_03255 [Clostridiales bacterium]|nr:hypothetical protein [Clostridiales bacterium]